MVITLKLLKGGFNKYTMKKLLSLLVIAFLALSVMPLIAADGDDASGGINVDVEGTGPVIYTDNTQRSWYPNDQTIYTAGIYGTSGTNLYGDDYYNVGVRGNYVFAGETVTYYTIVEDIDGQNDIDTVTVLNDGTPVGSCSEIIMADLPWIDGAVLPQYTGITYDDATMNTYRCVLVVQNAWTGTSDVTVEATDDDGNTATSAWSDSLIFNPSISISLAGAIDFGTVVPDSIATSNSVVLSNSGTNGVVLDMYIASDDYFTDPSNPTAICGVANGIPYDAFSYYATKGSVDSGDNNNAFPGVGDTICDANADEFTDLPSHSGQLADMCRIINHVEQGSFLSSGQSMSLTFELAVPTPCRGSFTDGEFHFRGEVV